MLQKTAELRSFCGIMIKGARCSFRLSAEALKLFSELDVEMEASLIFVGYSDDELPAGPAGMETQEEVAEGVLKPYRTESKVSLEVKKGDLASVNLFPSLGLKLSEAHSVGAIWILEDPVPPAHELDKHVLWIGDYLSSHENSFAALSRSTDVRVRCEYKTESDNGGFGVSPQALHTPVRIGLPFEFDVSLL